MNSTEKDMRKLTCKLRELREDGSVKKVTFTDKWGESVELADEGIIDMVVAAAAIGAEREWQARLLGGEPSAIVMTREYLLAKRVEEEVNSFSFKNQNFVAGVTHMHRTLQQSFGRLLKACIVGLAEAGYDARNEATVRMCRELKPVVEDAYLPMV